MPRTYADITRFKEIESSMRGVVVSFRKPVADIDKALAAKRTQAERALLQSIRDKWEEAHKHAQRVIADLWAGVEELSK